MKRSLMAIVVALLLVIPVIGFAKAKTYKHAAEYKVATLDYARSEARSTIIDSKASGGVHLLTTNRGTYRVEPPVSPFQSLDSNGRGFALNLASGANLNSAQEQASTQNGWFMDVVEPGTKILFASECSKADHANATVRCQFWFPYLDATHEYALSGDFTPIL